MTLADYELVWNALPQPALLIDGEDVVTAANPAAEAFFYTSAAQLRGRRIDVLSGSNSRLADLVARARGGALSLADHGVDVALSDGRMHSVDLKVAALDASWQMVLVLLQPRTIADQMDRTLTHRAAARSVTGMAGMLAHEIKNPLAGIST